MNNFKIKIKEFINKIKHRKESYSKSHIRPHRDWFYILVISNAIIVCMIVYAGYLYFQIDSDRFVVFDPSKAEAEIKINTDLLNKIVLDLNNREQNIKSLDSGKIPLDPSR